MSIYKEKGRAIGRYCHLIRQPHALSEIVAGLAPASLYEFRKRPQQCQHAVPNNRQQTRLPLTPRDVARLSSPQGVVDWFDLHGARAATTLSGPSMNISESLITIELTANVLAEDRKDQDRESRQAQEIDPAAILFRQAKEYRQELLKRQ